MCSSPDAPKKQVVNPTPTPAPMANPEDTPNANTVGGLRVNSAGRNALRIDLNSSAASTPANGLTIPKG